MDIPKTIKQGTISQKRGQEAYKARAIHNKHHSIQHPPPPQPKKLENNK